MATRWAKRITLWPMFGSARTTGWPMSMELEENMVERVSVLVKEPVLGAGSRGKRCKWDLL